MITSIHQALSFWRRVDHATQDHPRSGDSRPEVLRRTAAALAQLHDVGCQRDQAGNRQLHFDQYCVLMLLAMFSPIIDSMRSLQRVSELPKVQKRLGVKRVAVGSLSEAVAVFDPERLRAIVEDFAATVPPLTSDPRLADLKQAVTLVDGTILTVLPKIAAAFWSGKPTGRRNFAWRLHTHFEVLRGQPNKFTLTDPRNAGDSSERNVLRQQLEADRCYVLDRGFQGVKLLNDIAAAQSSYVCRIQEKTKLKVIAEYPLSDEARQQHIVHDALVKLGDRQSPDHPVRVVTVEITPHVKCSGHKGDAGPANQGLLVIATNLVDVPAEIIALLFAYRWQIELFFRFFKCLLGCQHLFSHHRHGILIQTYCAVLACLVISLWTGASPTRRPTNCSAGITWAWPPTRISHDIWKNCSVTLASRPASATLRAARRCAPVATPARNVRCPPQPRNTDPSNRTSIAMPLQLTCRTGLKAPLVVERRGWKLSDRPCPIATLKERAMTRTSATHDARRRWGRPLQMAIDDVHAR